VIGASIIFVILAFLIYKFARLYTTVRKQDQAEEGLKEKFLEMGTTSDELFDDTIVYLSKLPNFIKVTLLMGA
jgi:hypothetical protein